MSRRGGNWDAFTGGAVIGAAAANRRKQDEIIRQQRIGIAQDAEQARRATISEFDDLTERLHERGADSTVGDYFAYLAYALTDLEAALRAASFKKEKALRKRVSPGSIYFVIDPLKGYASDYLRIGQLWARPPQLVQLQSHEMLVSLTGRAPGTRRRGSDFNRFERCSQITSITAGRLLSLRSVTPSQGSIQTTS